MIFSARFLYDIIALSSSLDPMNGSPVFCSASTMRVCVQYQR
jgi:hypothetical protein